MKNVNFGDINKHILSGTVCRIHDGALYVAANEGILIVKKLSGKRQIDFINKVKVDEGFLQLQNI